MALRDVWRMPAPMSRVTSALRSVIIQKLIPSTSEYCEILQMVQIGTGIYLRIAA